MIALLVVTCVAFTAVAVRLTYIQSVASKRYAAVGISQRVREVPLAGRRGVIYDRAGRELALSMPQKTIWANPHLVTDPVGEARQLAAVLGIDENLVRDRLTRDAGFVYIARKVDDEAAAKVEALRLPGIATISEEKRFAPSGDLAASVVGRVGLDNDGLSGLELQYEERLAGVPGRLIVERDTRGNRIANGVRDRQEARRGVDLVLTIDRSLQYETERALSQQIVTSNAKGGIAIVMDPRSGEILALANLTADPNGGPPRPSQNNDAVTKVFEPGSVNKIITVAAALEEGLYTPSDSIVVPDQLQVADHRFRDHDPHATKPWTVTDILANSSNVGTIKIAQRLGRTRVDRYLRDFGLGSKSGLSFPGESAGLLLRPDAWSGTSMGTVPIGQGLAVTAVQMLAAYNTLANDGVWVEPRLVKATVDGDARKDAEPAETRRVVSVHTARQLTAMMTQVVKVGTGTLASIQGYTVAGKTGTARKPLEGARGYKAGAYVSTFAGYVPAESPRLSSIVILDEPTPIFGGLVSAPVFAAVSQYALRLFRIPPPPAGSIVEVPAVDVTAAATADGGGAVAATRPSAPAAPKR